MTDYKKLVHFFGEMDLDLSKSKDYIGQKAFDIAESCGYMSENRKNHIVLYGLEGEKFVLSFDAKGVLKDIIDMTRGKNHVYGIVNGDISTLPEYYGYGAGFY